MPTKAIESYEGFYEVDDLGNIYSLDRFTTGKHGSQYVQGKQLKPVTHKGHGYSVVNLSKNGKTKQHRVHILVAKAYIPNPCGKPTVNHKNGIKADNRKSNLEWADHQEQMDHARKLGLTASHTRNGCSKLNDHDIHCAFARCMAGEELQEVSADMGVNRNALPNAFRRVGLGDKWAEEAHRRKQVAALKRWCL